MIKPDLWRSESCNLLYDKRYSDASNGRERYDAAKIICKDCKEDCMFAGVIAND